MTQMISIHSYCHGTGKSYLTANLATLLAVKGLRVGVIETDIQSPGLHIPFGWDVDGISYTLNDYLSDRCDIEQTAYNIFQGRPGAGALFLVSASKRAGEITRVLQEGYEVWRLKDGFEKLSQKLALDVLIVDTYPGLSEESMVSIAVSDVLVIVMRAHLKDYQGTAVLMDAARQMGVPRMVLVANIIPRSVRHEELKAEMEKVYKCEVGGIIPYSDEIAETAMSSRLGISEGDIFVLNHPRHPITATLDHIANQLV